MIFKKSGNIRVMFLANQKLETNMLQIFKTKYIANFRKHGSRKKSLDLVK